MQNPSLKSAYIHVPFCKNICSYCDFCKNYYNEKIVLSYLEALEDEIKENYKGDALKTLYVGGGTPSCLSIKELDILFKIISKFNLSENYEFTFECNYEDINDTLLRKLKENNVNRISIGLQTFNKKFKDVLKRNIDKQEMIKKVNLAKKYFNNINIDLMYALGNQSLKDLKQDVLDFISLKVSHISTYSLIVEENTKLFLNKIEEVDEDTQGKMYNLINNILTSNGYKHYEISNFSLPGFESKHNLTYWNNENYYGFGAGASGFVSNVRYDNTRSVFNYIKGRRKIYEEKIDKNQMIKDEVMLGFRKINGIDKLAFLNKYGISIDKVFNTESLIKEGLLEENKTSIFIPLKYLFVSNEIILKVISSYNLNYNKK